MTNQAILNLITSRITQAGRALQPDGSTSTLLREALQLPPEAREALVGEMIDLLDAQLEAGLDDEAAEVEFEGELSEVQQALDWAEVIGLGYLEPPPLTPDEEVDRLLARQKEMMDAVFGGIGEEKKEVKRVGLAFQQLQIEQQHALRLILCYPDLPSLLDHLKRCLVEPAYGYSDRGNNGRTIAQALGAVAGDIGVPFEQMVQLWWEEANHFRRQVLAGSAVSMRPRFDDTTLDTFTPILQRAGDMTWRLGLAGHGQHRDFEGELLDVWDAIADTFVAWCDADNERWLSELKRQAARLPDSLHRVAWAERLRKEVCRVALEGQAVKLHITRLPTDEAWPRSLVFGASVGLTRLSGHAFYELAWDGGQHVRRFDVSSTTRQKVPVEHTEIAVALAEALAGLDGPRPEPATPGEIEAAFLHRMKAARAELGPPETDLPLAQVAGKPLVSYRVGDVTATWIQESDIVVCAVKGEKAIVLQYDERQGVLAARPVVRGRVRWQTLMTTPIEEIGVSGEWMRALMCWAAWLAWTQG